MKIIIEENIIDLSLIYRIGEIEELSEWYYKFEIYFLNNNALSIYNNKWPKVINKKLNKNPNEWFTEEEANNYGQKFKDKFINVYNQLIYHWSKLEKSELIKLEVY